MLWAKDMLCYVLQITCYLYFRNKIKIIQKVPRFEWMSRCQHTEECTNEMMSRYFMLCDDVKCYLITSL